MARKKQPAEKKPTKPSVDVKEPVPAEEPPVPAEEPPVPAEESPVPAVDTAESPEPEVVVPGTQDPVEPVKAEAPEADVPEAPVPEPKEPEAAPEAETQQAETAPVHQKPFVPTLRDPRLPEVGSVITRQYKGTTLEVLVTEGGFEFAGDTYSSISKVAAAVSSSWAST